MFKVKKSSHSKKIRRQIDREKEERKKKGSPKIETTSDDKVKEKNQIIATEEVTIKIKNPIVSILIQPSTVSLRVLLKILVKITRYSRPDLLPYPIKF